MNEVTKINLGRQVFTIATDARHNLKSYLANIEKQVIDKEVIDEIEIRMAELLSEKGLDDKKVVLEKDVEYLKKQLGSPEDFKEDKGSNEGPKETTVDKRLFRDTDNAMVGGVAAGLANFFGIDALLVRILFVILFFITFGGGILLYILLWILVPEAKTTSDRLQMVGKPVTVESLKQVAKNTDVKGAAKRASDSVAGVINRIFTICLKIIGVLMSALGLSVIFGLISGLVYFLTKSSIWAQYNIFPIGTTEHALLYTATIVVALTAVFIILFGIAIFKRKWPIHTWITGTLAGLLLIGLAVCGALGASVYPTIRDAYNSNLHASTRVLQPFNAIISDNVNNWNMDVNFEYASSYYVTMNYYDRPNLSNIKTTVNKKALTIDTSQFNQNRNCQTLCVPDTYSLNITVHSPNFNQLESQFQKSLDGQASPQIAPVPVGTNSSQN